MVFASRNAFLGCSLSRRDDLISLCYFLIYLMDGGIPFCSKEEEVDQVLEFENIGLKKTQMTAE